MDMMLSYPFNKIRWSYKTLSDSITLVDLELKKKGFSRNETHNKGAAVFYVCKTFPTLILKLFARRKHGV